MRESETTPPDPDDSHPSGLDVFARPSSPGLQLLPWRESSLDGLGAAGKVSSGRALVGKGGQPLSRSFPTPFLLYPGFPPLPALFPSLPQASLTCFSPFPPFASLSLILSLCLPPSFPPPPGKPDQRHLAPQLQGLPSGQRQAFRCGQLPPIAGLRGAIRHFAPQLAACQPNPHASFQPPAPRCPPPAPHPPQHDIQAAERLLGAWG